LKRFLILVFGLGFLLGGPLFAELRSLGQSEKIVADWMEGHRLLGRHEIQSGDFFRVGDLEAGLHLFHLSPAGYLIVNQDDRLPLVLAFSGNSPLSLDDTGTNTLRVFLQAYVESIPERLEAVALSQPMSTELALPQVDVYVAPMLTTAWNQTHPYNLLLPEVTGALSGYDGRAPVGCVSVAYSQILNYHRWPLRGTGAHSYTDSAGPVTGTHSVSFDTVYDWDNMRNGYSVFGFNPPEAETAVSKLMWDLVVGKEANIEADETSAVTLFLGRQLARHHYMEAPAESADEAVLQAELQDGYPAVVTIPGHAVVADGLLMDGDGTAYHIQYGWGGQNDGWFAAHAIPGGALSSVIVGIRPALMPFARESSATAPANQSVTLPWIFPRHRATDVSALRLYRQETLDGTWSAKLGTLPHVLPIDWERVDAGARGDVWFAGPNGPATLSLSESFSPGASSTLRFDMQYRLGTATLHVEVSTDGGLSYQRIYSVNDNHTLTWAEHTVSLAAFAGDEVMMRFFLGSGTFYSDGGVWLDTISVSNTEWRQWSFWKEQNQVDVREFSSEVQVIDEADDFSNFQNTSNDNDFPWTIVALDEGNAIYKQGGGYSNRQYHLTSVTTLTPAENTRLALRARHHFATDFFRVLASTDGSAWAVLDNFYGTAPRGDLTVDLNAYVGQAIYLRLEYVVGSFFADGGIWIDRVSLESTTNPELEGQPLHFTAVGDFGLSEGSHLLAATAVEDGGVEHRLSPSFTLHLTPPETSRGTPHSWLMTHGGVEPGSSNETFELADLDDSVDTGFPLWKHYVAGTTPGNPLQAIAPSFSGSAVTVRWIGQAGRLYKVLRTQDLAREPASWSVRGSVPGLVDGDELQFSETPDEPSPWFYALEVGISGE